MCTQCKSKTSKRLSSVFQNITCRSQYNGAAREKHIHCSHDPAPWFSPKLLTKHMHFLCFIYHGAHHALPIDVPVRTTASPYSVGLSYMIFNPIWTSTWHLTTQVSLVRPPLLIPPASTRLS